MRCLSSIQVSEFFDRIREGSPLRIIEFPMGLLTQGHPLSWADSKAFLEYVREHGIEQLINTFKRFASRQGDPFFWGEEVEAMIVTLDSESSTAELAFDAPQVLEQLDSLKKQSFVTLCMIQTPLL